MTLILEIKLQKYIFLQNMITFLAALRSFLKPYEDGSVHTYATTKELKQKTFTVKIHNIKEAINMQVTLISENKSQIELQPFFKQTMRPC